MEKNAFSELGIAPHFVKRLTEINIVDPTEVQREAIPLLLEKDRDLIAQAQTGTGKTAAFGLPLLQRVSHKRKGIQALVLSPTRELAKQIGKELFRFTFYCEPKIFSEVVSGGEPMDIQISRLRRPTQVVVATPGRLIDLLKRNALDITTIRTLVLDEADEMLKLGFKEQIKEVLEFTGESRRSIWLFSATLPDGIQQIIKSHMDPDAKKVVTDKKSVVARSISHKFIVTENADRFESIRDYLEHLGDARGVIFSRTRAGAIGLARRLEEEEFEVDVLHGDLSQRERDKAMRAFRKERVQLLVSTDVSARGIDVEGLEFVLHEQLPEQIEGYTHRSGRTGRAGKKGISIAFIHPKERNKLQEWEKELGIVFSEG